MKVPPAPLSPPAPCVSVPPSPVPRPTPRYHDRSLSVSSILISVVAFGHSVAWWQWIGILCVFGGLSLSVRAKYAAKKGGVETSVKAGVGAGAGDVATKAVLSGSNGGGGGDKKKEL